MTQDHDRNPYTLETRMTTLNQTYRRRPDPEPGHPRLIEYCMIVMVAIILGTFIGSAVQRAALANADRASEIMAADHE